jgi:hypothetical protein
LASAETVAQHTGSELDALLTENATLSQAMQALQKSAEETKTALEGRLQAGEQQIAELEETLNAAYVTCVSIQFRLVRVLTAGLEPTTCST